MNRVRDRALTEETRKTRFYLLFVSALMALILILGVEITQLSIFGTQITFGKSQLLIALMFANVYFTFAYTTQSLRDQADHERIYDIASHDELVGKPIFDRLESVIKDLEASKHLSREGHQDLASSFITLAHGLSMSPSEFLQESEDFTPVDTAPVQMHIQSRIDRDLSPVEPILAAKLATHMDRMVRRSQIYSTARMESFLRAESFTSLSHMVPSAASTILTLLTAYALFDPDLIVWFQGQMTELDEVFSFKNK